MEAKVLKDKLDGILQQKNGIIMYAVLKKDETKIIKLINVADEGGEKAGEKDTSEILLEGFTNIVKTTFETYDDSTKVLPLSSADERKNGLYQYDLDELPEEMKFMKEVLIEDSNIVTMNFNDDKLQQITAFIIVIGNSDNNIVLYKHQYPIGLLKRDKCMLTPIPHKNRLKKVEEDILRVDFNFQFCLFDNKFFVSDIDKMEKICSFHTLITNEAKKSIDLIKKFDILDNIEVLEEELDNVTFARKLTRVYKDSKVLGKVLKKTIVEFTKNHSYFIKNPLKCVDDKFVLDTKKSRDTFIKLINDDFLKSELTNYEYESLAKNISN